MLTDGELLLIRPEAERVNAAADDYRDGLRDITDAAIFHQVPRDDVRTRLIARGELRTRRTPKVSDAWPEIWILHEQQVRNSEIAKQVGISDKAVAHAISIMRCRVRAGQPPT